MATNSTYDDRHPAQAALRRAEFAARAVYRAGAAKTFGERDRALAEAAQLTSSEWVRQEQAAQRDGTHLSDAATLRILGVS